MNPMQIEHYNKKLDQKIKHNQVQFSIVHSHMISEGIFVNMTENESCIRSGNLIEYSMLNEISLQAWSPLMASWEDGSFIDNPKYDKLNKKLEELADQYKTTKNSIAISWILRHPANIIPIVGTTKVNHLLEIVKAKEIILTKEEWYSLYLASGHLLP
jgi:predicted oxidoreductase